MVREDEYFRGSNRVEPFLDPTPDSREERGCANDLGNLVSMHLSGICWLATYKYSIQCLWVVSSSQRARVLHMTPQIPELLESYM